MDGDQMLSSVLEFFKGFSARYYFVAALLIGGLIFLSIGMMQFKSIDKIPLTTDDTRIEASQISQKPPQAFQITIDVEGAVVNPGVYKIPTNSRVQDALIAAGGLSSNADREVVSKKINLAAKVIDGGKIYLPKIGEQSVIPAEAGIQNSTETVLGADTSATDINSATVDALDNLPGVGPVTAQKIISARPYNSVNDLLTKKVVSNSVFQKIKDLVVSN